jgi:hypothetical protein
MKQEKGQLQLNSPEIWEKNGAVDEKNRVKTECAGKGCDRVCDWDGSLPIANQKP